MKRSPVTQATPGFHGNGMTLSGSGITSMSGSAGVMSNHVANPAKPAPAFATDSIALAGTIFARIVPNKSTNAIRKYFTSCRLAISFQEAIYVIPLLRLPAQPPCPGIQSVPANGTRAMAAASTVSATRSSGSRL
jgi:hypothetical protein